MDGDSESISQSTRRAPSILQFALTIQESFEKWGRPEIMH